VIIFIFIFINFGDACCQKALGKCTSPPHSLFPTGYIIGADIKQRALWLLAEGAWGGFIMRTIIGWYTRHHVYFNLEMHGKHYTIHVMYSTTRLLLHYMVVHSWYSTGNDLQAPSPCHVMTDCQGLAKCTIPCKLKADLTVFADGGIECGRVW
jgi:hypothetical protein